MFRTAIERDTLDLQTIAATRAASRQSEELYGRDDQRTRAAREAYWNALGRAHRRQRGLTPAPTARANVSVRPPFPAVRAGASR